MLILETRRRVDWWLGKAQVIIAGVITACGAAAQTPSSWAARSVVLQELATNAEAALPLLAFTGPIAIAIAQAIRKRYGSPWAAQAVQRLLDEFQQELFRGHPSDPLDHHRVTLFKHGRSWCNCLLFWKGPDQLRAVGRSNHLTRKRIQAFHAPDDPEKCEGVAGKAWRRKGWVCVPPTSSRLPTLTKNPKPVELDDYCRETGSTAKKVREALQSGRGVAQSFAALAINLNGQRWGVIVVDSRCPQPIDPGRLEKFGVYDDLLTPLLERM